MLKGCRNMRRVLGLQEVLKRVRWSRSERDEKKLVQGIQRYRRGERESMIWSPCSQLEGRIDKVFGEGRLERIIKTRELSIFPVDLVPQREITWH